MKIKIKNVEDVELLARKYASKLAEISDDHDNAIVVAMYGDLGSGKTTFVKSVAKAFGLSNTVTSPTFVIEKIYPVRADDCLQQSTSNGTSPLKCKFDNLIHIDAYRLKSGEELKTLGWDDISRNPKNIIFIEWPSNVKDILPKNTKEIYFEFIDEHTREIEIN